MVCSWQVRKSGMIKLRPVYSEGLWGLTNALHHHGKDDDGNDVQYRASFDTYKNETFEYEQESNCGCRCYVPSDNLEFLEWKYEESRKSI